jgi:hypothetical protein
VFVDGDEITGVIDWSEAGQGDALYDLASLTLGHEEHLGNVVAGYGTEVDLDVIRAWWSLRSLRAARWLIEHGFDLSSPGCEFAERSDTAVPVAWSKRTLIGAVIGILPGFTGPEQHFTGTHLQLR